MISAGEFRNGVTFEQDGQVLQARALPLSAPRPRT